MLLRISLHQGSYINNNSALWWVFTRKNKSGHIEIELKSRLMKVLGRPLQKSLRYWVYCIGRFSLLLVSGDYSNWLLASKSSRFWFFLTILDDTICELVGSFFGFNAF